MLESILLLLSLINMVIAIIACIKGGIGETNENILKALIISTGAFIFLVSIMWRLKL